MRNRQRQLQCTGDHISNTYGASVQCVLPVENVAPQVPFFAKDSALSNLKLEAQTGIDVMLEDHASPTDSATWLPAELVSVVAVPAAAQSLTTLLGSSCGGWDYGGNTLTFSSRCMGLSMWDLYTAVAVLRVPCEAPQRKWVPGLCDGAALSRGQRVWVAASPFGLVSPRVFHASVSTGVVANIVPHSSMPALLVTDARGLAGSEGGVVVDQRGQLLAMMAPPLQRTDGPPALSICITLASIAAVLPAWDAQGHRFDLLARDASAVALKVRCASGSCSQWVAQRSATCWQGLGKHEEHTGLARPNAVASSMLVQCPITPWQHAAERASRAVVAVRVGSLWGSGILISADGCEQPRPVCGRTHQPLVYTLATMHPRAATTANNQ